MYCFQLLSDRKLGMKYKYSGSDLMKYEYANICFSICKYEYEFEPPTLIKLHIEPCVSNCYQVLIEEFVHKSISY